MGRRTDLQRALDEIKGFQGKSLGTRVDVITRLVSKGWTEGKAAKVIEEALADPLEPLVTVQGGRLQFTGSDIAIYKKVAAGLLGKFGEKQNWRHIYVENVSDRKASGQWTKPDPVVIADPGKRDSPDEPRRVHSIEVEYFGGFGVPSVYQAYEQGRGADYRWLLGVPDPGWTTTETHGIPERLTGICKELGVGLVVVGHVNHPARWEVRCAPKRQRPEQAAKDAFLGHLGVDPALLAVRGVTGLAKTRSLVRATA